MTIQGDIPANSLGYCVDHQTPTVCSITFSLGLDSGRAAAVHRNVRELKKETCSLSLKGATVNIYRFLKLRPHIP